MDYPVVGKDALVFTFPGNPRSDRVLAELGELRREGDKKKREQKPGGFTDEAKYESFSDERAPLLQMYRTAGRIAVALVDTDVPCGKHFQLLPSGSPDTRGLPSWTTAAKYVVKVGRQCCGSDARRCAELLHAIFVRMYQERMAKYPLPWGPAKDPAAEQRRRQKRRRERLLGKDRIHYWL